MARRSPQALAGARCRACLPGLGPPSVLVLCGTPAAGGGGAPAAPARGAVPSRRFRRGPARSDPGRPRPFALDRRRPRKVWARLRMMDGIQVARKRVLRVMGEHALLSPHRARTRPETAHERNIITAAPNVMWAPMPVCRSKRRGEMGDGPPQPACRSRLQTTVSGVGQKPGS